MIIEQPCTDLARAAENRAIIARMREVEKVKAESMQVVVCDHMEQMRQRLGQKPAKRGKE